MGLNLFQVTISAFSFSSSAGKEPGDLGHLTFPRIGNEMAMA